MRRSSLLLLIFALLLSTTAFAEKVLTNDDIIKLTKVGLGDEAITAKIHQAAEADFSLETDDLAKLKSSGVSGKVIAAMLDRSSGGSEEAVAAAPASAVKMIANGKTTSLASVVGDPSSTYVYVTVLYWMNFPSMHATIRTTDHSPSFLIAADRDPRSRYYVVRLDANDEDADRSLKMGRSGAFSFKAGSVPDSDWTFPFESSEEKRGVWKVSLKKSLVPGEYGVYNVQGQELFDFGVD
jgi:hypothetical protein